VSVAGDYIHIEAEDIVSEKPDQPAPAGERYSVDTGLARPGAVTYLHIPATDTRRAAAFYRDVFGWSINHPDSDRPSFDDASGLLSGAWISDHLPAAEPGLLPYIYVADVEATVGLIVAHGGAILTEPYPEGLLTVTTFRDPAGNVIGLWHDTTRAPATSEQIGMPATEQAVAPVPEHLHTVTSRLALTDPVAAIDFYAKAFDACEVGERHCAPDGTLIHAELRIGDSIVMVTEDEGYKALLCTYWPDVDAAWERATAAGAHVLHPLTDQFYGERGGRLKDPFDQEWMLSTRLEKLTAAEIAARAPAHD
jgi:predicted enzyme related to lactoylglutathione lyase